MEKKNVISRANMASRIPLFNTVGWITVLHYWNAPEWLWGVIMLILLLGWILSIKGIIEEKQVDIFDDLDRFNRLIAKEGGKSKFQQRLEDALKASKEAKTKQQ